MKPRIAPSGGPQAALAPVLSRMRTFLTSGPPRKLFTAARISSARRRSCAAHDGDRVATVSVPASNATGSERAAIDFPATRGQRGATFPISCTLPRSLLRPAPRSDRPEQRGEFRRMI